MDLNRDGCIEGATIQAEKMKRTYGRCLVISDFDGTITTKDTNVEVQRVFGNDTNKSIRADFNAGRIGIREAMPILYKQVKITEEEYNEYISSAIVVDQGFAAFQKELALANVPLIIISGGNIGAVVSILKKNRLEVPQILANKFFFNDTDIEIVYYHKDVICDKSFGPCGNCKARHIQPLKKKYDTIIFIGDGPTDRCAAELADYVYAKDKLADYCREQGIAYTVYTDFDDISRHMFEE